MEITGTLRNAVRVPRGEDCRAPCLKGRVYGDVRRRFYDGDMITTSTVLEEDGDVFTTRNSVYRVESWAETEPKKEPIVVDMALAFEQMKTNPELVDAIVKLAGIDNASMVNKLVDHCHGASVDAGWWPGNMRENQLTVSNKLMLIVSEIAEAMEGDRKNAQDDKLPHRKMIEVELADALIRIADLAGFLELDLGGAVVEKMAFNSTRLDHKAEARAAADGKAY